MTSDLRWDQDLDDDRRFSDVEMSVDIIHITTNSRPIWRKPIELTIGQIDSKSLESEGNMLTFVSELISRSRSDSNAHTLYTDGGRPHAESSFFSLDFKMDSPLTNSKSLPFRVTRDTPSGIDWNHYPQLEESYSLAVRLFVATQAPVLRATQSDVLSAIQQEAASLVNNIALVQIGSGIIAE